jgi:hypothetical protein
MNPEIHHIVDAINRCVGIDDPHATGADQARVCEILQNTLFARLVQEALGNRIDRAQYNAVVRRALRRFEKTQAGQRQVVTRRAFRRKVEAGHAALAPMSLHGTVPIDWVAGLPVLRIAREI